MKMEIKSTAEALQAVEAVRAWTRTKLPAKLPQPWNGHSPEQCMLINVQTGLGEATYNLNRYEELLKNMAGGSAKTAKKDDRDDNPLL
jgi:hypothetical protein